MSISQRTDHEPVAHTALKSKIKKDRVLSHDTNMTLAVTNELSTNLIEPAEPGSHLAKVQSHLLSSKVLAQEVSAVVDALKLILKPEPKNTDEGEDDGEENEDAEDEAPKSRSKKPRIAKEDEESSDSEGDADSDADSEPRQAILSDDEEEGGDDGWESGSIDGGEGQGDKDVEDSESEDEDEESESGDTKKKQAEPAKPKPKPSKDVSSKGKAGESTFLPSLAVGYTRGDSDSDWSDGEAAVVDTVKKNRRGQRARQA